VTTVNVANAGIVTSVAKVAVNVAKSRLKAKPSHKSLASHKVSANLAHPSSLANLAQANLNKRLKKSRYWQTKWPP
jgi:hypothetical protein